MEKEVQGRGGPGEFEGRFLVADEVDDHAVGVVTFGVGDPLVDLAAMQLLSDGRVLLSHTINLPIPQPTHTHSQEGVIPSPFSLSPLKTALILNALLISYQSGVYNPYLCNSSLLNIISTMGGGASVNYAVPVTQKVNGESATYRSPCHKDTLIDGYGEHKTMKAILINSANKYPNNPALGTIVKDQNGLASIDYLSYREAITLAQQIGSAMVAEKLYSVPEGEKLRLFGIFAKNRAEWTLTDIAANLYGFTTIPIYDTLGDENITYVFKHTHMTTVFVSEGALKSLVKCKDLVNVNTIICYDPFTEEQLTHFQGRGAKLLLFKDLYEIGKAKLLDYNAEEFKVNPEDCLTFSYTSGTTGPPKGAMISHRNFASFMGAQALNKDTNFQPTDVGLSYLPLPHILEREFDYAILTGGGRIVYFSGDVQKLKDDLAIVKPTIFLSVPRLFSRFYDVIKGKFNDLQGFTKTAVDYALKTKLDNLKSSGAYTHKVYDRVFFGKTKEALGGKVRVMISGSAPLLPEVQNFLKVCMCCPLVEGYGQTETTGAITITDSADPEVRHVGGPIASFEYKLVDIPEMNYLSTDKDSEGNPTPRGEIWARGPGVFMGYYHDEAKTKQAITEDGWLKTGDVGSMSAKTRAVSIVDRKKNIFKLQQGEYVAAEKVENTLLKGDKLAEIFIHGESTECFVIAIAVPHKKFVEEFAQKRGVEGSYEDLCKNEGIRADFVVYLNQIGKEGGLQGFEQVKNIYLETQPFLTKGILTNTMKIQRHEAKKFYRPQIDQLYKEGMLKTK